MDLLKLTTSPRDVTLGDRTFKVGPMSYLSLGVIQHYLDESFPDAKLRVGSGSEWIDALFADVKGVEVFLSLLFSSHQTITPDDLGHILTHVGPKQIAPLFQIAMDLEPSPPAVAPDPTDVPDLSDAPVAAVEPLALAHS